MAGIYLDSNATTRPDPAVVEAMQPFLEASFGNPSSVHSKGQAARHAVEKARESVAALINATPETIAFTATGTHSDRMAIAGLLGASPGKHRIVTTAVEHSAVLHHCRYLESKGYDVVRVGVDHAGHLDLDAFAEALNDETALASVMLANNETGVIFPIREVAQMAASRGIPLHVDAVQAAGKLPIDVATLDGVQLVSLSAHKIHGSQGAGALWIRGGTRFVCPFTGARTARDIRVGTENVPAIVGFGVAADLSRRCLEAMPRVGKLRDQLELGILAKNENAVVAGDRARRTANTTTICFGGLIAEGILIGLSERGVFVSSGSACSSGSIEPSHVLQAMGLPQRQTLGAVRFSLSRETTSEEIANAIEHVNVVVGRLQVFAA